ncbi:hypothetical protein GFL58_18390 [Rhizobium leguminosarum bv. viciae]|nr:hypothetical protein [Rhizobium leguminosarum bv. viciae]
MRRASSGGASRSLGAVSDSHPSNNSPAPKDLGALDSCDEHRNDGGEVSSSRRASLKDAFQRTCPGMDRH